jgi:hypothetical protein
MRHMHPQDLTGQRFGRLVAIRRVPRPRHHTFWWCQCDCGGHAIAEASNLRKGCSTSCGCRITERARVLNRTHGRSGTREHRIWKNCKTRCYNTNNANYPAWGGRGITMCDEWRHDLARFFADMGPCPAGHTLERIDNNGRYEPSNCRWASMREQSNNRRDNHRLTWDGQTHTIREWERLRGFKRSAVRARIHRGWSVERALTTPIR